MHPLYGVDSAVEARSSNDGSGGGFSLDNERKLSNAQPIREGGRCTVLSVGIDIANSVAGFAFEREMSGR
jgi:hypothetical protein